MSKNPVQNLIVVTTRILFKMIPVKFCIFCVVIDIFGLLKDAEPTDKTPSPDDTPGQTPVSEEMPEITDAAEDVSTDVVTDNTEKTEEVKEEWDVTSEEDEEEEKESSPDIGM